MNIFFLLLLEILLFCFAYIVLNQDIMAPSVVMCAMFIISTLTAIINIHNWSIHYSFLSIIVLISGIFCFFLVEALVKTFYAKQIKSECRKDRACPIKEIDMQRWLIAAILIFNLLICHGYYLEICRIVNVYGLSVHSVINSYRILFTSTALRTETSAGATSVILNQCLKVVKATGYVAGYILLRKIIFFGWKRKNVIYIFIILTSLIPDILSGARAGFIDFICAILIESYILRNWKYGWKIKFSRKYIKIGLVLLLIGIPAFYFSLSLVGRKTDKLMFEYVSNYLGGSIELFNRYVQENGITKKSDLWGEESFSGIYTLINKLGYSQHVPNVNIEYRHLNKRILGNVYTFFRRPLHDFGYWGMCMFTCGVSFVYSWLYYGNIKGREYFKKTEYATIVYGYLYREIIYASIDQRSQHILSLNAILILIIALLLFFWITNVHVVWNRQR